MQQWLLKSAIIKLCGASLHQWHCNIYKDMVYLKLKYFRNRNIRLTVQRAISYWDFLCEHILQVLRITSKVSRMFFLDALWTRLIVSFLTKQLIKKTKFRILWILSDWLTDYTIVPMLWTLNHRLESTTIVCNNQVGYF